MNQRFPHLEKGQALVLIVIVMGALLAMLVVTIDGGYSYANRRSAQNAADAAALAGARELCRGNGSSAAIATAHAYATVNNEATSNESLVVNKTITVTAHVRYTPFLAQIMGWNVMTATAQASAGCFAPCSGTGVLPIAWSCNPPTTGGSISNPCDIDYSGLYVIMNSDETENDMVCRDPVLAITDPTAYNPGIDCDMDNDGEDDAMASGDRSWLDLNGGGGGSVELSDWVKYGFPGAINVHTWFSSQSGNAAVIYRNIHNYQLNKIVILPVFDQYSDGIPVSSCSSPSCNYDYHPEDTQVPGTATSQLYYHVYNFSAFRVTCVEAPGIPGNPSCPGKAQVVAQNPQWTQGQINKLLTVEGYFIENYVPGLVGACGDAPGTGVYTIYLK